MNASPQPRRVRILGLTALFLTAAVVAQHALDANLSTQGRRNVRTAAPTMNAPLYSVNRHTGEMQYNRMNAFGDSAYASYTRRGSLGAGYRDFNAPRSTAITPSRVDRVAGTRGGLSNTAYSSLNRTGARHSRAVGGLNSNPYSTTVSRGRR